MKKKPMEKREAKLSLAAVDTEHFKEGVGGDGGGKRFWWTAVTVRLHKQHSSEKVTYQTS